MGSFICRQPNGLLCRFSTVVDTVTHYNMTDEEYIQMKMEQAREYMGLGAGLRRG